MLHAEDVTPIEDFSTSTTIENFFHGLLVSKENMDEKSSFFDLFRVRFEDLKIGDLQPWIFFSDTVEEERTNNSVSVVDDRSPSSSVSSSLSDIEEQLTIFDTFQIREVDYVFARLVYDTQGRENGRLFHVTNRSVPMSNEGVDRILTDFRCCN